ncbi:MAG: group 1 glycosyl transferase [Rhodocyclaceae bacterium]|nr:MAG: group 1 glycosyl transferase [Rhodocyclaceae bacterium]TNC98419.1 MAG: group 1 glycosyl transferase [Rhodocyclaceae bacterium]
MVTPKILFVSRNLPYPPVAGSSQRTANLIDALREVGDVSLFVIGPQDRRDMLEKAGYRVAATAEPTGRRRNPFGRVIERLAPGKAEPIWRAVGGVGVDFTPDPGLQESLRRLLAAEKFDLIVGRYLIPSAQAGIFEPGLPPAIVDIDDVDSKSVAAKIASPASGALLRTVLRTRHGKVVRHEQALHARAARLWFSNPDDLALSPDNSDLVPNIPFALPARDTLQHSPDAGRTILWVGSFNHRVNLEGVVLFLQQAWPAILRTCPDARFRIVGSSLPDKFQQRWQRIPGVDVVGFAPSLAPHYAEAAITIVPLLDGAGTKIKVLESLGYLRTSVVTRHSVAGFESLLQDGESLRVADTLEGLAEPVVQLLGDHGLRHTMESRGRSIVESCFAPTAVNEAVRNSVERLIGTTSSV